jgi:hypothetical protein
VAVEFTLLFKTNRGLFFRGHGCGLWFSTLVTQVATRSAVGLEHAFGKIQGFLPKNTVFTLLSRPMNHDHIADGGWAFKLAHPGIPPGPPVKKPTGGFPLFMVSEERENTCTSVCLIITAERSVDAGVRQVNIL